MQEEIKYNTQSTRMSGWDYGAEAIYFVTICTKGRARYFGEIQNVPSYSDDPCLTATHIGIIADNYWKAIPEHFPFVELDEYVIMPDHIHGIINIATKQKTDWQVNKFGPQSKNLPSIIRGFKSSVKAYANNNSIGFERQPKFYDRIIRSDIELQKIRKYIQDNPLSWTVDKDKMENLYR